MPVRHGTGGDALDRGAGHLYGTSLPIGGENTHSIISAHTGLADRLMFDLKASNNLLTISSNGRGRTEDRRSHHLGVSDDGGKRMVKRVLKG
ncbi:sortase [Bifidobacterium pseudocatenulatum]|uniref:sortase n=1 Tax=Bifidobacterium pseudocatenulatum TaxID=28026 RepID=UPI0023F1C96E|nr:sortase [Bifidobacterium pseudocatenulatum]